MRQSFHAKVIGALAACFAAALFLSAPAQAQCGSPPDPRTNTAGYASWCSCMGGSYNYQTTACTGARGPSTRSGGTTSSGNDWPAQHWYCRARAGNGASGWARYGDRADAERAALGYCDQYARGRACRIVGCSYVGGTPPAETASPSYSAPSPTAPPETPPPAAAPPFGEFRQPTAVCGGKRCMAGQVCGPTNKCYDPTRHYYCGTNLCVAGRRYAANSACGACTREQTQSRPAPPSVFPFAAQTCAQCYHKLKADIRVGYFTRQPRSYITGAINGYEACKQKVAAGSSCTGGDNFRTTIRGCASTSFNDAGARACVSHALTNDTGDF